MNALLENQYIYELLIKAYEGDLTDVEKQQLNEAIKTDNEAALIYLGFFDVVSKMNNNTAVLPISQLSDEVLQYDQWLIELAEEEKKAPTIEIPKEDSKPEIVQKVIYQPREKYKMTGFRKFTLAACAAIILFFVYLHFAPQKPSSVDVATLVDQLGVRWSQSSETMDNNERLWTNGGAKDLKKGFVKIHFDNGVDVLIEGPASFEIERSGVYLEYGRLYSRVSETGMGFRIETPTSQYIDLGTEFAVQADVNGSSELHVIKGKVQLYAGLQGRAKVSQLLSENSAARYDADTEQVKNIPIRKSSFVRNINSKSNLVWRGQKTLSLADIIGGGNGFGTGSQDQWIEVVQAKYFRGFQPISKQKLETSQYRPFGAHPFIDGVFIPNGQPGPLQVSSIGHEFKDCPITNGSSWNGILNSIWRFEGSAGRGLNNDLVLDGVKYNTVSKPSINIHSNQGITFDLNAVRNHIQVSRIARFTAKAGISQSILDIPGSLRDENGVVVYPKASFYVLIDGEVRFEGVDHDPRDPSFDIQIDLSKTDHFLTLIATQGSGGSTDKDWALFAEPFLHLE